MEIKTYHEGPSLTRYPGASYNAAMFSKKNNTTGSSSDDTVKLRPLLGIRPGVYLTVLYALIIGVILFFILLYPGIKEPGGQLSVTSEPQGAAVRVDGVYRGTTPTGFFVSRGSHSVDLVMPGFVDLHKSITMGSRIFASRFFPARQQLSLTLTTEDPLGALVLGAQEFERWSFTGEPSETYQFPLVLSEAAYRLGPALRDPATQTQVDQLTKAAVRFANNGTSLRDLSRAKFYLDSAGLAPSPLSALRSLRNTISYLSENPGTALWLETALPKDISQVLLNSDWYHNQVKTATEIGQTVQVVPASVSSGETVSLGGLTFRSVSGGTMTVGGTYPQQVTLTPFKIAETEVSEASWKIFVAENPEWAAERRDELVQKGLVNSEYLLPTEDPKYPAGTVPGVSWYAAQAFCQWLTTKLPAQLRAYEVRLPTEFQWEWAAAQGGFDKTENLILKNIKGGLWEWCADPFAPLSFLSADKAAQEKIGSPERTVKGGSWANDLSSINLTTRGSLPPNSCSVFVGFRPIIALKNVSAAEGSRR